VSRNELSGDAANVVQARDIHGNVYFHALKPEPGQIVVGRIPHEPPNFQLPEQVATLAGMTSDVCVVCAVTGQRGVGKTQVAAAYARQRVRDGWLVAWINAESPDRIQAGLTSLAERLDVHNPNDDTETAAARLRDHLQSRTTPTLLTFDNLIDLAAIAPYLPGAGPTQVVITSTIRGAERMGRAVPVDVFDEPTALRFLRAATGLDDDEAARTLAAELGHLPLALAQAAARIRAGWTYQTYLDRHRGYPVDRYLTSRPGDQYPLGAPAAILIALEPFSPSPLLDSLAVLSPDGVTRDILPAGDEIDDELERLYEASIIEFAGDHTRAILMHRLVQRIIRDRCRHSGTYSDVLLRQTKRLGGLIFPKPNYWEQRVRGDELVRQVDALWENSAGEAETMADTFALRFWAVRHLNATAQFLRAVPLANAVVDDAGAWFGDEDVITLRAVANLADSCRLAGRVDEAVWLLEPALASARRMFGDEHRDTLELVDQLGHIYISSGQLDKAISLLERSVADCRRLFGDDHPDTLTSMTKLAEAYREGERFDEAISLAEQSLAHRRRVLGDDHPDTLYSAFNLANTHGSAGRHDEAIRLLERALANYRRVFGDDHQETLSVVNSLACVYGWVGRRDDATSLLEHNLLGCRRAFGTDHPNVFVAVSNLAQAYEMVGRLDDAIQLYELNLADRRRVLGHENPDSIKSAVLLVAAYQSAGRLNESRSLAELVLSALPPPGEDLVGDSGGRDEQAVDG
jgi:tetratricopeptide (TPR) repeat protein